MVSRILKFLNRESAGINEAALLLGLFTFMSQILGLVRDRLLATYLGAGSHLDLYYAAFKIPDFLYVSVATLASITVLLPYLSSKYGSGQPEEIQRTRAFLSQVFSLLLLFLIIVSTVVFIAMPWLVTWVAPGFNQGQHETLITISRIMLAQPIIIGVSNMFSSVTQMFRNFFVTALAPVFYNLGIIIGIVLFYQWFGLNGLAYGVILGALLHMAIQLPTLISHRMMPRIVTVINWSEIKSIVTTSIPRTLGLSINSLTLLVLTAMASLLGVGAVSLFSLTNNMLNVPIGIIGVSYAVASFPTLVKFFNNNEREKFAEHIVHATRKIIFWSVPVMVLFIILRAQIVRVILGSQSFSWNDTRLAAACLALFILGLVAQSLTHLFVRGYYAVGNTKKPLMTNFFAQISIIGFAFLFLWLLRSSDTVELFVRDSLRLANVPVIDLLALPLAFAVGNIINSIALLKLFITDFPETNMYPIIRTTVQTVTASVAMGFVTYGALNIFVFIFKQNTFWGVFAQGFFSGLFGFTMFMTVLLMVRNEEMVELVITLKKKFWKTPIVVMDQSGIDK